MSVKMRQFVEKEIAKAFIKDALAAGYSLNIDNGGDVNELPEPSTNAETVLEAMFATDDEYLLVFKEGKKIGWVWFVYGNDGWDVISDYSGNLANVMSGASAESDKWAD